MTLEKKENEHTSTETPILWILILTPHLIRVAIYLTGLQGYGYQFFYKIALIAGPIYWFRTQYNLSASQAFWPWNSSWPSVRLISASILSGLLMAFSAIGTILLFSALLKINPEVLRTALDSRFQLTPAIAIGLVFYLFTLNAALEEYHFRHFVDLELDKKYGQVVAILLSSCLFAAMHLTIFAGIQQVGYLALALVFIALVIAGVCWSFFIRQPGGIYAAWLSHGLTDAILLGWGLYWLGYY